GDADELSIGTDHLDPCADTPTAHDEADDKWPPDFDDNQVVNVTDVFNVLPPTYGSSAGQSNYSERADLEPDGVINITDVFKVLPPIFGKSCL
ncbi:MAG: hypothetical protein GTN78_21790, partial [Gemmatimonadales bacterium]|nr:hypothetical protein [Gemmatimonadales bacterium]